MLRHHCSTIEWYRPYLCMMMYCTYLGPTGSLFYVIEMRGSTSITTSSGTHLQYPSVPYRSNRCFTMHSLKDTLESEQTMLSAYDIVYYYYVLSRCIS